MAAIETEGKGEQAIVIQGVRKLFGKFEALKGVDLAVEQGTIFGLLGANGAGKTTLIKTLVGSLRLSAGKIQILGLDPIKDTARLRAQIGYMPQAPALYEDLSARANISFFGAAHHIPNLKKRVDEVLEFTNLTERQNDPAHSFSGGMKQRLSLACTLVHEPQVLFLDEPTAGVDPKLREAFWKHFRQLAEQGHTIFISTHLMDEALFCDKLAVMRDGLVLAYDTPKGLMRRGTTRVRVQKGGLEEVFNISDYPSQLPSLLTKYNLDPTITKIEIEEDTLEKIVLDLIDQKQAEQPQNQKEVSYV